MTPRPLGCLARPHWETGVRAFAGRATFAAWSLTNSTVHHRLCRSLSLTDSFSLVPSLPLSHPLAPPPILATRLWKSAVFCFPSPFFLRCSSRSSITLRIFSFSFSLRRRNSDLGALGPGSSPPLPECGTRLRLYPEKASALSSLVDSHPIDHLIPTNTCPKRGWNGEGSGRVTLAPLPPPDSACFSPCGNPLSSDEERNAGENVKS